MGKTRRQDDPFVRQVVSKQGKSMVYIYMGTRIGNGHKLPPSPAGAMFSSPLQTTTSAAQHHRQEGDYARLGLVRLPSRWNATISYACFSLRETHLLFDIRLFSIPNPRASYPPTPTHSFDIQTMSSLNKTYLMHRSVYSQGISYIIVATSLSPRFGPSETGSLARAWNLRGLHRSLQM